MSKFWELIFIFLLSNGMPYGMIFAVWFVVELFHNRLINGDRTLLSYKRAFFITYTYLKDSIFNVLFQKLFLLTCSRVSFKVKYSEKNGLTTSSVNFHLFGDHIWCCSRLPPGLSLRNYCWCSWGTYGVSGIKFMLTTYKSNVLPVVLSLWLRTSNFYFKDFFLPPVPGKKVSELPFHKSVLKRGSKMNPWFLVLIFQENI